jgi:hypothetical protein
MFITVFTKCLHCGVSSARRICSTLWLYVLYTLTRCMCSTPSLAVCAVHPHSLYVFYTHTRCMCCTPSLAVCVLHPHSLYVFYTLTRCMCCTPSLAVCVLHPHSLYVFYTLTRCMCKVQFNSTFQCRECITNYVFLSDFLTQILYEFLYEPCMLRLQPMLFSFVLIVLMVSGEAQTWSSCSRTNNIWVKLSLCLIKQNAMETYGGGGGFTS